MFEFLCHALRPAPPSRALAQTVRERNRTKAQEKGAFYHGFSATAKWPGLNEAEVLKKVLVVVLIGW